MLLLHDQRDARGLRYALLTVLVFVVLANLAGEDGLRGIAQWVAERRDSLAELLGLAKPQAPYYTTNAQILARAVRVDEFEQVVGHFFATLPQAGHTVEIALDGKTLRGMIPVGQTRGVHLLAAYLPGEGLVLMQETLFAPEPCIKGFSPAPKDLRSAETLEKGHGRIERRTLTVSRELKGYGEWPYAEQVFQLERAFQRLTTGQFSQEVVYGVSSLTVADAAAARLLAITRRHWGIERGLHYRRDITLHEDRSRVRTGQAPQVLAAINNLVLGLFARLGYTRAPEARRHFAAHVDEAVNLVLQALH